MRHQSLSGCSAEDLAPIFSMCVYICVVCVCTSTQVHVCICVSLSVKIHYLSRLSIARFGYIVWMTDEGVYSTGKVILTQF